MVVAAVKRCLKLMKLGWAWQCFQLMFGNWDWGDSARFYKAIAYSSAYFAEKVEFPSTAPDADTLTWGDADVAVQVWFCSARWELRVDKQSTHFGQKLCSKEQPTLSNLFCVSIELITGSKFRDIFLGDSRDIFLAARHFPCLISNSRLTSCKHCFSSMDKINSFFFFFTLQF